MIIYLELSKALIRLADSRQLIKSCRNAEMYSDLQELFWNKALPLMLFLRVPKHAVLKQPSRGVPRKRCSENILQSYTITPILKCDYDKVTKQLY